MKRVGQVILVFGVMLPLFVVNGTAAAKTISVSQEITVTAKVVASQIITVNSEGKIIEIVSNSSDAVTPRIFENQIAADSERSLTPEILASYRQILLGRSLKPGTIYKQAPSDDIPLFTSRLSSSVQLARQAFKPGHDSQFATIPLLTK